MQDLKTPPSTSASSETVEIPATIGVTPTIERQPEMPAPAQASRRRSSLRMQYRFLRVVVYLWWLFARLVFWQVVLKRYLPEHVERTNLERWRKYARSFRAFAVEMGGVMIKLGQFISTRSDILPPEVIDELAALRDEVPGVPSDEIRAIIERELGPIPEHFEWFDERPVAAASLGQVHRARLRNGDRVVVKVQRPNIDELVHTDLAALKVIARYARRFAFVRRRADTVALANEFGRVLLEELSYRNEARNAARFAEMFRDDTGVYIPQVYTELSTDRVLTLEDVTTIKLNDYAALEAAGISRKAVAQRLMDTYLKQVFEERFFHADPHPGNLFVYPLDPEGELGHSPVGGRPFYLIFVDFGMTGSLTPEIVAGLVNTLTAVITRDARKLVASYQALGFLLPGADTARLEEATKAVFDQVWGMDMAQIGQIGYNEIAQIGSEFSDLLFSMPFQMPQDFIYLARTFGILGGLCTSLDPTFNPWHELQPYTQKLMAQNVGANGDAATQIAGTVLSSSAVQNLLSSAGGRALANIGQSLLGRSHNSAAEFVARLERGEIKLTVQPDKNLERQLSRIEAQGRRTTRAVLAGSGLITSTLLYIHGDTTVAAIGYGISALLLLATWLTGE
ncbi:MAG: AarF/UbiB family protein [Chloroflexota bacterium]|nr:MAG: ABC transporter [Chloroflexota bacterium]